MEKEPRPIKMGTLVGERFEVEELLGQGGFGNVYLVRDRLRNDLAVMKELAPQGARRLDDGVLSLDSLGAANAQHLRQRFVEEARLLAKLHLRGIPQIRATLTDLGTAFFVSDYVPNSKTLQEIIDQRGTMDVSSTLDVLHRVLDTLEGLHEKGYLHRDLKPSNILVSEKGDAYLLDFGSAREWHADAGRQHTVLFTPGYAPMEQLSERARRGPATDIYALCATAYHLLTGRRPTAPPDRSEGVPLVPIRTLRPEVPGEIAAAIEKGLALSYNERPQTAAAFRQSMEAAEADPEGLSLAQMDERLVRLRQLSYSRRQCPACKGVLEEPKPLKKGLCPVCHEGSIRQREIHERLCPVCKVSALRSRSNIDPLVICPVCAKGELHRRKKGLLGNNYVMTCAECEAHFVASPGKMTLLDAGTSKSSAMIGAEASPAEWRIQSGRGEEILICDGCSSQFDTLPDGRRKQMVPPPGKGYDTLYPDEWARVASGLEPGAGNAFCPACEADYFLEGDMVTLLDCDHDPHGFGTQNLGRLLTLEEFRWIGVGKDSPHPGFVCNTCRSEFDREGDYMRLIQSPNRKLQRNVGAVHVLEDWHRLAQGLPTVADEEEFVAHMEEALRMAYRTGELSFDNAGKILWRGEARRDEDDVSGTLEVTATEVSHGGRLRRWKVPLDAVSNLEATPDTLTMRVSGERMPLTFQVSTVTLEVDLESGRRSVELGASDLAARLVARRRA